jgi:hypothetical protein
MKTFTITKKLCVTALTGLIIALTVTGCSDDKPPAESKQTATKVVNNPFDHSHDVKVTNTEKHKFEKEFAQQCVQRELKHSDNKDADEKRFIEPCTCIASFLMKDLTAEEAEKFMVEHENAQSLVIKYENAAYHCLQQSAHTKGPNFSKQPQAN